MNRYTGSLPHLDGVKDARKGDQGRYRACISSLPRGLLFLFIFRGATAQLEPKPLRC